MLIIVRVLPHRSVETLDAVAAVAETYAALLQPVSSSVRDDSQPRYFSIEVPDAVSAERIADHLRKIPGVEAAYTKPPDALP